MRANQVQRTQLAMSIGDPDYSMDMKFEEWVREHPKTEIINIIEYKVEYWHYMVIYHDNVSYPE